MKPKPPTDNSEYALDTTAAMTYRNPKTGNEFSAALGVTFNAKNDATDYKSTPEMGLEMADLKHLPTQFVYGLTGYIYRQLGDDSGNGADDFRALIDARDLQARLRYWPDDQLQHQIRRHADKLQGQVRARFRCQASAGKGRPFPHGTVAF